MNVKFFQGLSLGLLLGLLSLFIPINAENVEEIEIKADANLPQMVEPVELEKEFSFAGEAMPDNFDTKERLDRELLVNAYWQSSTLLNLKAAKRYFPIFEKILAENNIPDDFKYLAVAESSLRHVTSPANAKGFWQFKKAAAQQYGLEINSEVDERFHTEKATRAACLYIKELYERFGSWTDAAAAYNVGPTNYSRILRDQKQSSFYDLNINPETSRYIFRLIAIKEILSRPERFGFYINDEDTYAPLDDYKEIIVNASVENWGDFAHNHGISYRMLKIYNPWLRDNKLTVIKNTYKVKVPQNI